MRRAVAAVVAAAAIAAGCAEDTDEPRRFTVGDGATGAEVSVPAGGEEARVAVIFLHGWGMVDPVTYRPWIDHLVAEGHVVIAPRYQDDGSSPSDEVLANAVSGVRAALRELTALDGVVAAGHSAGGALAADLTAVAEREGLPRPTAVFAVYPGRGLRGVFAPMPEVDLRPLRDGVRVEAWAGDDDPVVGVEQARRLARASGGAFRLVRDDAIDDHGAPQRADAAARRAFWAALDRIIAEAA